MQLIVTIAAYTGLRLNEILHLKYSGINTQEKIIEVINTGKFTTKTKKNRIIPVPDTLLNELTTLFSDNGTPLLIDPENYIFSTDGKSPYDKSTHTRTWRGGGAGAGTRAGRCPLSPPASSFSFLSPGGAFFYVLRGGWGDFFNKDTGNFFA
ncbi:MAG: site-specific integrase [Ignavibacteria bacterium]|nr:site-specific integrase [Ignavibacteria bacterium]